MAAPDVEQPMAPPPAPAEGAVPVSTGAPPAGGVMTAPTLGINVKEDTDLIRQEANQWVQQWKELATQAPAYVETVKVTARQMAEQLLAFINRPAPLYSGDQKKVVNLQRVFTTSSVILAIATIFKLLGTYIVGPVLLNWAVDGPTKAVLLLAGLPALYLYTPDILVPTQNPRPPLFMVPFAAGVGIVTGSMLSAQYVGYVSTGGMFFPLLAAVTAAQFDNMFTGKPFVAVLAATVGAGALAQLAVDTVLNRSVPLPLVLLVPLQAGLEGLVNVRFLMETEQDVEGKNFGKNDLNAKLLHLFIWVVMQSIGAFVFGNSYPTAPPS